MAQIVGGGRPDIFTMLRENLEKANRAPRCEYQKSNGQRMQQYFSPCIFGARPAEADKADAQVNA
ncbi:MAG: hypothetical protein ACXVKD_16755 [Candidatus Angelobacter sp.]